MHRSVTLLAKPTGTRKHAVHHTAPQTQTSGDNRPATEHAARQIQRTNRLRVSRGPKTQTTARHTQCGASREQLTAANLQSPGLHSRSTRVMAHCIQSHQTSPRLQKACSTREPRSDRPSLNQIRASEQFAIVNLPAQQPHHSNRLGVSPQIKLS